MHKVRNFIEEHPGVVTSMICIGGICVMGKGPAVISLPTILFLATHNKVRCASSSDHQRILAERCAIVCVSAIICKIFLYLHSPSSSYNISLEKTGMCLALGGLGCVMHFLVEKNKEYFQHRGHDFQTCPITCLAWSPGEWEYHIRHGLSCNESVGSILHTNCMEDVLEDLGKRVTKPKSYEEWCNCEKNQFPWVRLIHLVEFKEVSESDEAGPKDDLMFQVVQKYDMCGLLDFIWLAE